MRVEKKERSAGDIIRIVGMGMLVVAELAGISGLLCLATGLISRSPEGWVIALLLTFGPGLGLLVGSTRSSKV